MLNLFLIALLTFPDFLIENDDAYPPYDSGYECDSEASTDLDDDWEYVE